MQKHILIAAVLVNNLFFAWRFKIIKNQLFTRFVGLSRTCNAIVAYQAYLVIIGRRRSLFSFRVPKPSKVGLDVY